MPFAKEKEGIPQERWPNSHSALPVPSSSESNFRVLTGVLFDRHQTLLVNGNGWGELINMKRSINKNYKVTKPYSRINLQLRSQLY